MHTMQSTLNRQVIDITTADDDEVMLLPSVLLSDASCEALNAIQVLDDIASLLYIISNNQLSEHQYQAMARFAYETVTHTSQAQYDLLQRLNEPLEQSKFGTVEVK